MKKVKCELCSGRGVVYIARIGPSSVYLGRCATKCKPCKGEGTVPWTPPELTSGLAAEMVISLNEYVHEVSYIDDAVIPILTWIASKTPTHASWRPCFDIVNGVVIRNLNQFNPERAAGEILWYVEHECQRRVETYRESLLLDPDELGDRVAQAVALTGVKPRNRTPEAMAAFLACTLEPDYGETSE